MNPAVVEVGPRTIRGPNAAPPEWVSVAIECVDDEIGLLDERLVEVRRLWSDLLEVVIGERAETLVLIMPTWWSSARVDLVADAARGTAAEVVVLQRGSVLGAHSGVTVAEFSEELVVIVPPGDGVEVWPRGAPDLAAHLETATEVLIDVPPDVSPPAPALAAGLRAAGIPVAHSDRGRMLRAVSVVLPQRAPREPAGAGSRSRRRVAAVLAGTALAVAAVAGGWAAQALTGRAPADTSTALLVEGRVGLRVPARWTVERITSGPGSARLRVSAPTGDSTAIHVTQSTGASPITIADAAESLRRAIKFEPAGVFTDFDPAGSVGGRPAVTYRELRAGSETAWAVVIDGAVRIAVGCQRPSAGAEALHDACVQAVQSAHAVR